MTTLVKVVRNGQITLPKEVRNIMGIEEGDLLEVSFKNYQIRVTPKIAVDRQFAKGRFFKLVGKAQSRTKSMDAKASRKDIKEAIREVRKMKQK